VNDQQLADAVIALDIGSHQHFSDGRDKGNWYGYDSTGDSADVFVRDWRVAGALMEKCVREADGLRAVIGVYHPTLDIYEASIADSSTPVYGTYLDRSDKSLPRAVIKACVEALKSSHSDPQSEDQSEP
jgi:hypothetical protein